MFSPMSDQEAIKIQLVDDDVMAMNILSLALKTRGFDVTTCTGGAECLKQLDEGYEPNLIILDVRMPEPDGITTLGIIRESWNIQELPVILLTAVEEAEMTVMGFKGGANDFINKPVDIEELISRISLCLQNS